MFTQVHAWLTLFLGRQERKTPDPDKDSASTPGWSYAEESVCYSICSSVIKANGRYSWTLKSTFFPSLFTYAQLCLTLCNPMDCSPSGSSLHGIFQARILKQRCHFLHQGIFPTQGLNPCLESPELAGRFFTTAPPGKSPFPLSRLGLSKGFPGSCQPVSVRNLLCPDTHDWHLLPAVLPGSSCHLGQIYVASLSVS